MCKCQLLGSDIGLRAILHHSPYATVCIRNSELGPLPHDVHFLEINETALLFRYQTVNGKFLRFCEKLTGEV